MATKKQVLLPLALLVVAIAITFLLIQLKKPPEKKEIKEFIPVVKTTPLHSTNLTLIVHSQGTFSPKDTTVLIAQVSGKITKLSDVFNRGGFVKAGDVLAWIDDSDYQTQLIEAQANLASARASLQEEKAKGHVAEKEWQQISNASPSELGLRKPQLAQEVANVRAATAGVSRAKRNLERTEIVAPYDAIVQRKQVGLGSFVSGGGVIGEVSRINVGEIRLPITDNDLQYLINQGVDSTVVLNTEFNGKPTQWKGLIVRNEGIIDSKSRMNYLVAQVETPYELTHPLRFGSYVSAEIIGITVKNAVKVPRHLIDERGLALLTVDNRLHFEPIEIIRQEENDVVVSGNFNKSNRLITSTLDVPLEGMKLDIFDIEDKNAISNKPIDNPSGAL